MATAAIILIVSSYYLFVLKPNQDIDPDIEPEEYPPEAYRITIARVWPTNIDPSTNYVGDCSSEISIFNLYDPLIYLDWKTLEPKPFVAKSWDMSENGLIYAFHLRDDVKFHDGTILTAEDVKFSMERLLTMGKGYAYVLLPYMDKVIVIDETTVELHLKQPFGAFLNVLFSAFRIMNKDLVMANIETEGEYGEFGDYGEKYIQLHDAGSGPYFVTEFILENKLVMTKYEDYWLEEANSNRPRELVLMPVNEPITQRTMFINRELEFNNPFSSLEHYQNLNEIPGVKVVDTKSIYYPMGIKFHLSKAPLDDLHLRRAFAWCFDYDTMINELLASVEGEEQDCELRRAYGLASEKIPGALSANKGELEPKYERNMEKALEELKQSKYFNNISDYVIDIDWTAECPDREKIALLFASNLEELGDMAGVTFNIEVIKVPWLQCIEKWSTSESSPLAMVYGFVWQPQMGDISGALEYYASPSFKTTSSHYWYYNETFDQLFIDAMATPDTEERNAKYAELQKYIYDQCPGVLMGYEPSHMAYQEEYIDWYIPRENINPPHTCLGQDYRYIGIDAAKKAQLLTDR